jgi:Domain of unknown function (DUF6249)
MDEILVLGAIDSWEDIVALLGVVTIVSLFAYFWFRGRREAQATLRKAIDKDVPITPEFLASLGLGRPDARVDLRRGVLCIGTAIGLVLFGVLRGDPDVQQRLGAGAALLAVFGVTFLGLWWFGDGRHR